MTTSAHLWVTTRKSAQQCLPFFAEVFCMQDISNAQCVSYFSSQVVTKLNRLAVEHSVKVKWNIILLVPQSALQHFTTFHWIVDSCRKNQRATFPPFPSLFFIYVEVSLHCSAFMTAINRLFCPAIGSICLPHWHTTFVLCLRWNKQEIARHLGVKSSGIWSFSVIRIHSSWCPCS